MLKICPVCKWLGTEAECSACINRGHCYRMIGEDLKDDSVTGWAHRGFDWTIAHWERSWKEYFGFNDVCPEVTRLKDARIILAQFLKDNQHLVGGGDKMRQAVENYNRQFKVEKRVKRHAYIRESNLPRH